MYSIQLLCIFHGGSTQLSVWNILSIRIRHRFRLHDDSHFLFLSSVHQWEAPSSCACTCMVKQRWSPHSFEFQLCRLCINDSRANHDFLHQPQTDHREDQRVRRDYFRNNKSDHCWESNYPHILK